MSRKRYLFVGGPADGRRIDVHADWSPHLGQWIPCALYLVPPETHIVRGNFVEPAVYERMDLMCEGGPFFLFRFKDMRPSAVVDNLIRYYPDLTNSKTNPGDNT